MLSVSVVTLSTGTATTAPSSWLRVAALLTDPEITPGSAARPETPASASESTPTRDKTDTAARLSANNDS